MAGEICSRTGTSQCALDLADNLDQEAERLFKQAGTAKTKSAVDEVKNAAQSARDSAARWRVGSPCASCTRVTR